MTRKIETFIFSAHVSWANDSSAVCHLAHLCFCIFLKSLRGEVAADPRLQPGEDLGEPVIAEFLHLTEHSGAEEHLGGQPRSAKVSRGQVRSAEVRSAVSENALEHLHQV